MSRTKREVAKHEARGMFAHLMQELVAAGTNPVDWLHENVQIEREGKKIKLPADPGPMPIPAAIEALERLQEDEEQLTTVDEKIMAYPLEAAVAFVAAMEKLYGWASPVPTPSFFGPIPPHFISVQTDVDTWMQVPWGSFKIPGVENNVQIEAQRTPKGEPYLQVFGEVRKRERHVLLELAAATREILKSRSIYRGKALHITTNDDHQLDMRFPPQFIDLRQVDPDELIMNDDVMQQINTNIYAPIEHTAEVRRAKIPLKRGVLLEGRYGVGKTMTTRVTAKKCVDNGWTFITVDRGKSLSEALAFAQRYQPAVVFVEDIDRVTEKRDETANDLLNTIDGILSKSAEVMVVLTTNHVERIEQAMLRPGRLDAVITVAPPDAKSVGRLIQLYSRDRLRPGENLNEVGRELAGNIPSVIREVVERSKLAMIAQRNESITASDLVVAARGMKAHLKLLEPKAAAVSPTEQLGISLRDVLLAGMKETDASDLKQQVDALDDRVIMAHCDLSDRLKKVERNTEAGAKTNALQATLASNTYDKVRDIDKTVGDIHKKVAISGR